MKIKLYTRNNEGIEVVNHQLANKGILLSKEEWQQLLNTQKEYCHKWGLVETNAKRLERILLSFIESPYMSLDNYMEILNSAIVTYYFIRSKINWQISDDEICDVIYEEYFNAFGEQDLDLIANIIKKLNREVKNESINHK